MTVTSREKAKNFCRENLPQCCAEILEWDSTGVLRDGCVRKMVSMLEEDYPLEQLLKLAEYLVEREALRRVVDINPSPRLTSS